MKPIPYTLAAVLVFTGFSLPIRSQVPPGNPEDIYRAGYETAVRDGDINRSEQALLNTLQQALGLSDTETAAIRAPFLSQLELPEKLDQSGRWPLVAQNIFFGASMYGWMIPYVLDAKDPKWYIGSEMMSLGGAYYLTYRFTRDINISHARAQMQRSGSLAGLSYGFAINTLFDLGFNDLNNDTDNQKLGAWILMGSVPAGLLAGDLLYHRWNPSNGQAWSLSLWGELGYNVARQTHDLFERRLYYPDQWDYEIWWPTYYFDEEGYQKALDQYQSWKKRDAVFSMLGIPAGVFVGQRFFGDRRYSFGDAVMLYQGRLLGLMYAAILADLMDLDFESDAVTLMVMGGSVAGPIVMDRMIRGVDYTFGQSVLTALGTGSGLAFGVGLAAIVEVREKKPLLLMMLSGSLAGYYLANRVLDLEPESGPKTSQEKVRMTVIPTLGLADSGRVTRSGKPALIPGLALEVRF